MGGLTWLRADLSMRVDRAAVALVGGVDIASAAALGDGMAVLVDRVSIRIVVGQCNLEFCEACGLGTLLEAAVRTVHRGGWLRIAATRPPVERIIEVTRLTRRLPLHRTAVDALATAQPGVASGRAWASAGDWWSATGWRRSSPQWPSPAGRACRRRLPGRAHTPWGWTG